MPYIVLTVAAFSSCMSEKSKVDPRTVFRYNESSGITSLDPAFSKDQANVWAVNQLFCGLVQMSGKMEIRPCIAREWMISDNGLLYTFHLRSDVYFHDDSCFDESRGRRVVAQDFAYSFGRILDPDVASPGSWVFRQVAENGFRAISDTVFEIRLKKSYPPFLGMLTMQYCSALPQEAIEKYGNEFRAHPVGCGPFVFKSWKEGSSLVLWKNRNYFEFEGEKRLPYMDAVMITFNPDKQSAFMEFLQKKLDFISGVDASFKDELLTKNGDLCEKYKNRFNVDMQPYLNTEYLGFMMDTAFYKGPLQSKYLRQAINYGFDRLRMLRYLRNNMGTPGIRGIIPPGMSSYDDQEAGFSYDPARASELLAKAGFPGGKGLSEITLTTTPTYLDLCEFIQGQLKDIGIKIRIEVNQAAAQRELVAKSSLSFFRASWIADYPDEENYLSLFYSKNHAPAGPNYTHFTSSSYDTLYEKAMMEPDDAGRRELYARLDSILVSQAPFVILYYDKLLRLVQKDISGLTPNAMNLLVLKHVRKNTSRSE